MESSCLLILDVIGIKQLNYKTALKIAVFHSKTLLPITSIDKAIEANQSLLNSSIDWLHREIFALEYLKQNILT